MKKDFHKELFDLLSQPKEITIDGKNNVKYKGFDLKEKDYQGKLIELKVAFNRELKNVTQGQVFYKLMHDIYEMRRTLVEFEYQHYLGNKIDLDSYQFEGDFSEEVKELLVRNNQEKLRKIFDHEQYTIDFIVLDIEAAFKNFNYKFEANSVDSTDTVSSTQKLTFVGEQKTLIHFLLTLYKTKRLKLMGSNKRQDFENYIFRNFNYSSNYDGKPSPIKEPNVVISKIIGETPVLKEDFLKDLPERTEELLSILESMKSEISTIIKEIENTTLRN